MHLLPANDRRASVRYKLRLPVVFYWNDGVEHTGGGFTRDIGIGGALILSSKCPPMGHDVRIEILLPSPDRLDVELRIECAGKVTRISREVGCIGFGVQGTFDDDHLARQIPSMPNIEESYREPIQMRPCAK